MTTNNFKFLVIFLLTGILFTTSCSKSTPSTTSTTTTTTGGTTTGGTTTTTCSFFPYKSGTKIKQTVDGVNYDFTYIDTVINGTTFLKSSSTGALPPGLAYARQNSSSEVIQYIPAQTVNGMLVPSFQTTQLKPNLNIGATWTDSASTIISGFSFAHIYDYKIIDKGFTSTILGKTYTNCIKVQLTLGIRMAGQYTQSSISNYYWACGFGYYKAENATTKAVFGEVTSLTL